MIISEILYMPILWGVFFLSGASALIYQIIWIRLFGLVFGGTTISMSVVVASFMGGLALGSKVFGMYAERVSNRIRLYGFLELALAVLGLAVFYGIHYLSGLVYALPVGMSANSASGVFIRLVFSFLILMIPTMIMGGTLPILLRGVTAERKDIIRNTGYLYAFNTLGAMSGAFAAGFFLIRYLGVTGSNLTAVIINLVLGSVAVLVSGKFSSTPDSDSVSDHAAKSSTSSGDRGIRYIAALTVTGFVGLALEMVWIRLLLLRLNNTTYVYSIVITIILFGLGLGGLLLPRLVPSRHRNGRTFGLILGVLGISILLGFILYPTTTAYAFRSFSYYNTWIRLSVLTGVLFWLLGFLPVFLMGLSFPIGLGLYAREVRGLSRRVGVIYAFNTLGSLAGSLLSVFVLIPLLGIKGTLLLCSVAVMIPSAYFLLQGREQSRVTILTAVGVVYTVLFLASASMPIPGIMLSRLLEPGETITYVKEGASSTVWISEKGSLRRIWIDNLWVSSTSREGTHSLLAHYPLLFHSAPKNVAGIAFGTGQTFGTCLLYPIENIDCVEIDPEVITACQGRFDIENYNILNNPRSRIIIDDGRFFLGGTKEKYDIITAEPLQPYTRGTVNLYSYEFYQACKRSLNPGGVVAQWLPVYNSGVKDSWSMIRTFAESFDHVLFFLNGGDGILLGSDTDIRMNPSVKLSEMALKDLDRIENGSTYALAGNYICSREKLLEVSRGYPIITDDRPTLEFTAPISHWNEDITGPLEMRRQFLNIMEPFEKIFVGDIDWELARKYRESRRLINEGYLSERSGDREKAYNTYLSAYQTNPSDIRAIKSLFVFLRQNNRFDLLPEELKVLLKTSTASPNQ